MIMILNMPGFEQRNQVQNNYFCGISTDSLTEMNAQFGWLFVRRFPNSLWMDPASRFQFLVVLDFNVFVICWEYLIWQHCQMPHPKCPFCQLSKIFKFQFFCFTWWVLLCWGRYPDWIRNIKDWFIILCWSMSGSSGHCEIVTSVIRLILNVDSVSCW